jgi:maltooligosyltrehalose trehalohydrolase
MHDEFDLGAAYLGENHCRFCVWAPACETVEVHVEWPEERLFPLQKESQGYHQGLAEGIPPGTLYRYRLDGSRERPDPASRYQPRGVHGPSQVWDPHFHWEENGWPGLPAKEYILYELHVGTFTPQGTFEAVIPHLDALKGLGVTALELMPVAQYPGTRNWGYDGTYPFAVQNSYGGPIGLKKLIQACHLKGLALVLDVVYNHLGPEGNYLEDFGDYFTARYQTVWGKAVNFDGPYSDAVRHYFASNALYWIREYHIDGLRLDALHAIFDMSPRPFVAELAETVHLEAGKQKKNILLMAESDLNDVRLIRPRDKGGNDFDVIWNDDFHHALHVLLTDERTGYYQDFGQAEQLAKAFREGFVYTGQYSSYRKRRHGSVARDLPGNRFVVFSQNHDQVGNRLKGDRLSQGVSFEGLKLAATTVLLSPFIPLLFMGEEYGETAPFQYFVSHSDPDLIESVRKGRQEEFAAFGWTDEAPDPQAEETYLRSKLNRNQMFAGLNGILNEFYTELIRLRKELRGKGLLSQDRRVHCLEGKKVLSILYEGDQAAVLILYFGPNPLTTHLPLPPGRWLKQIDSSDLIWSGPGSRMKPAIRSRGDVFLDLNPQSGLLLEQDRRL